MCRSNGEGEEAGSESGVWGAGGEGRSQLLVRVTEERLNPIARETRRAAGVLWDRTAHLGDPGAALRPCLSQGGFSCSGLCWSYTGPSKASHCIQQKAAEPA